MSLLYDFNEGLSEDWRPVQNENREFVRVRIFTVGNEEFI